MVDSNEHIPYKSNGNPIIKGVLMGLLMIMHAVLIAVMTGYIISNSYYEDIHLEAQPAPIDNFNTVANLWASRHEYNITSYNCINYSHDLKVIADAFNIDAMIINGCTDENMTDCHQWLRITRDFEPQTAEYIDYSTIYKYEVYYG
jgi:hypothetical protein